MIFSNLYCFFRHHFASSALAVLLFFLFPSLCFCEGFGQASDLGVVGLLDTPTARMQPDATFSTTYSRQDVVDFYSLSYQATPWLEIAFRYAIFDPRTDRSSAQDRLRDRSYEVKINLLGETDVLPKLAVGARDLVGTGVLGGEYIVASKKIGHFDFSAGLGWGRFSGRDVAENPLIGLDDRFERRTANTGLGGEARFDDLFSGARVGAFGGVEYRPVGSAFSFVAEYNSDDFRREARLGTVEVDSPVSFGVNWEVAKGLQLGASWQHGSQLGLRISSHLDTETISPRRLQTFPWQSYYDKAFEYPEDYENNWFQRMQTDARGSGYFVVSGKVEDGNHALIEYFNLGYALNTDAAERVMASAGVHLPAEIERVTLVVNEAGTHPLRITYLRQAMDNRDYQRENASSALRQIDYLPGRPIDNPDFRTDDSRRVLDLDVGILGRYGFFDPDVPLTYQAFLAFRADMRLFNGWGVTGQYRLDLVNNYDEVVRRSNSVLPRVRSDIALYLTEGESGVDHLYLQKRGEFSKNLYYHAYAGVLELQYSGVGGELLYFPFRSRVAVGANIATVRQRDFDGGFGLRDFSTTIGHVSAYWATPFYNFDVALHAGRYLAGDHGATLEANRTFASGWSVGVFATKTNVSAEDFGEGSFDKGIKLTIPFNALSVGNSRRGNRSIIRPIQRDGGARLDDFGTGLWDLHRSTRYDVITTTEDRLLHP